MMKVYVVCSEDDDCVKVVVWRRLGKLRCWWFFVGIEIDILVDDDVFYLWCFVLVIYFMVFFEMSFMYLLD